MKDLLHCLVLFCSPGGVKLSSLQLKYHVRLLNDPGFPWIEAIHVLNLPLIEAAYRPYSILILDRFLNTASQNLFV